MASASPSHPTKAWRSPSIASIAPANGTLVGSSSSWRRMRGASMGPTLAHQATQLMSGGYSKFRGGLLGRAGKGLGELLARADPELAVGAREVVLDRARREKQ